MHCDIKNCEFNLSSGVGGQNPWIQRESNGLASYDGCVCVWQNIYLMLWKTHTIHVSDCSVVFYCVQMSIGSLSMECPFALPLPLPWPLSLSLPLPLTCLSMLSSNKYVEPAKYFYNVVLCSSSHLWAPKSYANTCSNQHLEIAESNRQIGRTIQYMSTARIHICVCAFMCIWSMN